MSFAMTDTSDPKNVASEPSPFEALNKTLEALETRLDGLMAAKDKRHRPPAGHPEAEPSASVPSGSDAQAHERTALDATQAEAVRQIKERQRRLDAFRASAAQRRGAGQQRPAAAASPAAESSESIAALLDGFGRGLREDMRRDLGEDVARQLGSLRGDLMHLKALDHLETLPEELHAGLIRIEQKLSAAADGQGADGLEDLRGEVGKISALAEGLAREETVRDLDNRWTDICGLIGEIDPAALRGEIADMARRLDEMQAMMNDLPGGEWSRQIETEMRVIAGTVEKIAGEASDTAALGRELDRVNHRLDEISEAILAVSAASDGALGRGDLDRIEARLMEIGEARDGAENAVAAALAPHLSALAGQIERLSEGGLDQTLVERLDLMASQIAVLTDGMGRDDSAEIGRHLEAIAGRLDALAVGGSGDESGTLDRFEALVERAEARFAEPPAGLDSLHRQLEAIVERLDRGVEIQNPASEEAMRSLEAQILTLTEHLSDRTGLVGIEPRLTAIETHLSSGRQDVIEAASRAAEQAVAAFLESGADEFEGEAGDLSAVAGLAEDLRALEKLTRMSNDRSARAFDAVHDTLMKIAERLESLDRGKGQTDEAPVVAAAATTVAATQAAETAMAMVEDQAADDAAAAEAEEAPVAEVRAETVAVAAAAGVAAAEAAQPRSLFSRIAQRVRPKKAAAPGAAQVVREEPSITARENVEPTPPIDPSEQMDAGAANEPLEPGSGTPDINRILQKVREQQATGARAGNTSYSEYDRADFIAAARRAAQAAAAEVENTSRKQAGGGKSEGKGSEGSSSSRRRPILIAVGAVLLAVMSYPLVTDLLAERSEPADAPTAANRTAPEQPAAAPAEVASTTAPAPSDPAAAPVSAEADAPALPQASPETAAASAPVDGAAVGEEPAAPESTTADAGDDAPAADAPITTSSLERDAGAAASDEADPVRALPAGDDAEPATAGEQAVTPAVEAPPTDAPVTEEPAVVAQDPAEAAEQRAERIAGLPDGLGTAALVAAAENGEPEARFEIASRYMEGRDVEQDMEKAAIWYLDAAEQDLAPAQYRIANFYEKGSGVERDLGEAERWYRAAAANGNASAMHNLAVLYASGGTEGAADFDEAARWFAEAAEHGVSDSQFNLAVLYARGSGVEQDLGQSYKWFAIAAEGGDADAASKRDEVANAMTEEALERARAEVELWRPEPLDPEANTVELPEEWGVTQTRTASIDMAEAVRNIQVLLTRSGYDAGPPDGIVGARTTEAIKAFQQAKNMEPTGRIDSALVEALLAEADAG